MTSPPPPALRDRTSLAQLPPPARDRATAATRIAALVVRQFYLIRTSWPRLLELTYWPMMQILLWGFIQTFLAQSSSYVAQGFGVLLGGIFLWDVLFRSQIGLLISFVEEVYSHNLGHLLVSPLSSAEFVAALVLMSVIRTMIGLTPAALVASFAFGFDFWALAPGLFAFFLNLAMFGWAVGLIAAGIVLRWGLGAEEFAWAIIFAIQPIVGVFYPVTVLPGVLQAVARALPPTYVFEGMRSLILDGALSWELLGTAFAVNAVWFAAGLAAFFHFMRVARAKGSLLTIGE